VRAILSALQLDTNFVDYPVKRLEGGRSDLSPDVQREVQEQLNEALGFPCSMLGLAYPEFYELVKNCYALIVTGGTRRRGSFILRKGLDVTPDTVCSTDGRQRQQWKWKRRPADVSGERKDLGMSGREHRLILDGERICTARLLLRPWMPDDAEAALEIYGAREVSRWLAPAMEQVSGIAAMKEQLRGWTAECSSIDSCQGRWVIELLESGEVVGGTSLLPLPPWELDLQIGWQLAPKAWGRGLAAEAGHAVAHHAFGEGLDEIFSVVRPGNSRGAATARRIGMEWVGTTEKYYNLSLEVYRLRRGDLDVPALDVTPGG